MKRLYRSLLVCLMALLCAALFCACSGDAGNVDGTVEETENQNETQEAPITPLTEVILVRPSNLSTSMTELCVGLRSYLSETVGLSVKVQFDYSYDPKPAEGRAYLLIGNLEEIPLSKKAMEKADSDTVVYLTEDGITAIYAQNESSMWVGVQNFLSKCYKNGRFSIPASYSERILDLSLSYREGWALPYPAYTAGVLDNGVYNCGEGLSGKESDTTYMQVVRDTTEEEFFAYVSEMIDLGYTETFNNYIDGNAYNAFTDAFGTQIYVYYKVENGAEKGVVRAIHDRSSNVTLKEFCYETETSSSSEFYQFNANVGGDCFLIRTADESWIVIDGDTSMHGGLDKDGKYGTAMFNFMREKSGLKKDEKLVISCWHMSHPHIDHMFGFRAMLENHHDQIDLQRVMFNEPDSEVADHQPDHVDKFQKLKATVNTYYPDVMFLKAHSGMVIQLADVKFEILYTQDDIVDFWTINRETYYNLWAPEWKTYRNYQTMYNHNNSSMYCILTVGELSALMLGDGFRADAWLEPYYSLDTLTTDILKIAHHYHDNNCDEFYKRISAQGKPHYAILTNADFTFSGGAAAWKATLSAEKGQFVIVSRYDTIYGYKKVNGKIVMQEYEATYAYKLTV